MKSSLFHFFYSPNPAKLFVFILVSLLPVALHAQNPVTGPFQATNWTMEDGLPQSSVNDILQGADGYLWLATFGGLVRFDGASFTTYNRFNTRGMTSDRILNLAQDSKGNLWLTTENGFLRFRNGECTPFFIKQDSQVYSPLQVAEDSRGVLWLSVASVPYRFKDTSFVPVTPNLHPPGHFQTGSAILGHEKFLFRTSGDTLFQLADLTGRLQHNIQAVSEFPKHSNTYFFATSGDGVGRYQNGQLTLFTEKDGLPSVFVKRMFVDRHDQLWVVCYNGIARWDGTRFQPLPVLPFRTSNQYTSILQDNEGNYWIGSPAHGLHKLKPVLITTIGTHDGLQNKKMLSMVQLSNGKVLFATNCGGIYEWDGKTAKPSEVNRFLPNLCVWSIFQDSKGRIWFGSRSLYMTTKLGVKGQVFEISEDGASNETFAISEDRNGMIWIGTLKGVYRYDGKEFRQFTTRDGLAYNDTRVFYEDENGTLWIGSVSGLTKFQNGKFESFKLKKKGQSHISEAEPYIRAIFKDQGGALWLGTYGDGLIRMKNERITFLTSRDGLFDNIISHLVPDSAGRVWMGSNRGISWVSLKELNDFCDGKRKSVTAVSYGSQDGMESAETNGGFQPSTVTLEDGRLMFPTVSGVAVVRPDEVRLLTKPPAVVIEKVVSGGSERSVAGSVILSPDTTTIEIRYTALSFTDPAKVRFKYRMEGVHDNWYEPSSGRSVVFQNLSPGSYTFTVLAANHQGLWNEKGVSLAIQVLPHFWQTWWFRTLLIILFLIIGPVIYFYRVSRLKKEQKIHERFAQQLIESQESERRRIAADLHDGLGQQILIIKNRADLALQAGHLPDHVAEQLQEIRESAMSSIQDVRQISHALRPVHLEQFGLTESLNVLCDQLQSSSSIEWSYHFDQIDGLIPKDREINFYRIIQEAINNILKHSQATEASVMVRHLQNNLQTVIWDDGAGFDLSEKRQFAGMGLSGMTERAKTFPDSTIDIQSSPGNGTVIKFNLPLK